MNSLKKKKKKERVGSKFLALRLSMMCKRIWSEQTLRFNERDIKMKNWKCFYPKYWISLSYWEIRRSVSDSLSVTIQFFSISQSLIQQHLLRFYYVPGTFLGIEKNDRTKSSKNQLKISGAASLYKNTSPSFITITTMPILYSDYKVHGTHLF